MQTATQGTEPASETPSGGDSEGMTAAELAYFRSGGEDSGALEREWGGGTTQEKGGAAAAGATQDKASDEADVGDDDAGDVDGEVVIDANGRVKDSKTGRFVPHKAFHAVREKYKGARAENEQLREKVARFDERLAVLNEALGGGKGQEQHGKDGKAEDDPEPDPEKDIFAYVRWQKRQIDRLSGTQKQDTEARQREQAERTFRETYVSDAQTFLKATPDFPAAYTHLVAGRDRELAAFGMTDAAERKATIAAEERAIVQEALNKKLSPSKVLYDFALARGYTKKAAPPPGGKGEGDGNGADILAQIEQIATGQRTAGASLSNGGGGASSEGLTADALLRMSDAEYDAVVAKLSDSQRRKLLGG